MENYPFEQKPVEAGAAVVAEEEKPQEPAVEATMDSRDEASISDKDVNGREPERSLGGVSAAEEALPYGITGPDGVVHAFATLGELRGYVQELREEDSQ